MSLVTANMLTSHLEASKACGNKGLKHHRKRCGQLHFNMLVPCLHFHESAFLVLSYNKWRVWRSKVILFLKENYSRRTTWVLFKSATSGKLLSYCTDAFPEKHVRNWQTCSVQLGGALQVIPQWPKPAKQQRELLERLPAVSIWQQMEETHPSDKKLFGLTEQKYCRENSYLLQIWLSLLCVHGSMQVLSKIKKHYSPL